MKNSGNSGGLGARAPHSQRVCAFHFVSTLIHSDETIHFIHFECFFFETKKKSLAPNVLSIVSVTYWAGDSC